MGKFSRTYQLAALAFAFLPQVYCDWTATFYDASDCGSSKSAWVTYTGKNLGPGDSCTKIGEPGFGFDCNYVDKHSGTEVDGDCQWGFNPVNGILLEDETMCQLYKDPGCTVPVTDQQAQNLWGLATPQCIAYTPPPYSYFQCWDGKNSSE